MVVCTPTPRRSSLVINSHIVVNSDVTCSLDFQQSTRTVTRRYVINKKRSKDTRRCIRRRHAFHAVSTCVLFLWQFRYLLLEMSRERRFPEYSVNRVYYIHDRRSWAGINCRAHLAGQIYSNPVIRAYSYRCKSEKRVPNSYASFWKRDTSWTKKDRLPAR